MKYRVIQGILIAALLVPLTGCPPMPMLGLWLFSITIPNDNPYVAGLNLQIGGQTQIPNVPPPQATDHFTGMLTWMQNDSTFTMSHVFDANAVTYTGTVNSGTSMNGTWTFTAGQMGSGTWTAEKL